MLTALDIKNITFSKSMGGYKPEDVEIFLDRVEADYVQFDKIIKDYQQKVDELQSQIEEYKNSQSSIQNVLLSAQKLADQIVNEAKEKSEEIVRNAEANISVITAQEKELANAFEYKANERKDALQKELDDMISKAKFKADSINNATADCINRQEVLFNRLKLEIAAFKTAITEKYKEHLNILQTIPDTVELSPKEMAEIISAKIDELPNPEKFIPVSIEPINETIETEDIKVSSGFKVDDFDSDSE